MEDKLKRISILIYSNWQMDKSPEMYARVIDEYNKECLDTLAEMLGVTIDGIESWYCEALDNEELV